MMSGLRCWAWLGDFLWLALLWLLLLDFLVLQGALVHPMVMLALFSSVGLLLV